MRSFVSGHFNVVCIRVKIYTIRDVKSLTFRDIVLPGIIILVSVVTAVAAADDGEIDTVSFRRCPVDFTIMLADIDALVYCPRNGFTSVVDIAIVS